MLNNWSSCLASEKCVLLKFRCIEFLYISRFFQHYVCRKNAGVKKLFSYIENFVKSVFVIPRLRRIMNFQDQFSLFLKIYQIHIIFNDGYHFSTFRRLYLYNQILIFVKSNIMYLFNLFWKWSDNVIFERGWTTYAKCSPYILYRHMNLFLAECNCVENIMTISALLYLLTVFIFFST
jgi:hypothetical protein